MATTSAAEAAKSSPLHHAHPAVGRRRLAAGESTVHGFPVRTGLSVCDGGTTTPGTGGCSFCRRQRARGSAQNTAPPALLGAGVAAVRIANHRRERAWRQGWWQRVGTYLGGGGTSRPNRSRTQVRTPFMASPSKLGVSSSTNRSRPSRVLVRKACCKKSPTMGSALWAPWPQ